jgi:hypothetical protein
MIANAYAAPRARTVAIVIAIIIAAIAVAFDAQQRMAHQLPQ